jgi:hypothetical protein
MEHLEADDSEYIDGKKEMEVNDDNAQELNKDSESFSLSKSIDSGSVSYQNDALLHHKGHSNQGVGSNSKPMDFLTVPTHVYPNDTLTRQRRNAIKHDFVGGEDILVNTEADVEESVMEIPASPIEINTNTPAVFEDIAKAPLEDLVRQLTSEDEENERNLASEMQIENDSEEMELRMESFEETDMKNNSLKRIDKEKRWYVDFSSENRSPVLKRRNSDMNRKKKGRDYKVVQFVEDEPELIQPKKPSVKHNIREDEPELIQPKKSSVKHNIREMGMMRSDEKHKLLEEIQQLREEKLREEGETVSIV